MISLGLVLDLGAGGHQSLTGVVAGVPVSYTHLDVYKRQIQPFAIKLVTTKKDRAMRMPYRAQGVSKRLRIMFPIVVSVIAGLVAPSSVALVGFLMFGNLIRECGVLSSLSQTCLLYTSRSCAPPSIRGNRGIPFLA